MKRVYNFSAGPAILPEEVLMEAANEMLDYHNSGMSVMEMSHRSKIYQGIIDEAEKDLRTLLNVPDNYKILFLQGGATTQFSMVPLNLLKHGKADYIISGHWAKKAYEEAKKYGEIRKVASSEDKMFSYIPNVNQMVFDQEADYVFMTDNNTIYGTKFYEYPDTGSIPLVNDASSSFLSEPMDVSKFGMIFAGAQKNVGPAGTVIVIIREDLITKELPAYTPIMLRYDIHAENGSMYNTPPTYGIYLCGKVFKWLLNMGGLEAIQQRNIKKANMLYDYLDQSKMFFGTVEKKSRSLMNVCFKSTSQELDEKFVKEAKELGFDNLKGHRSVGGMRASIYNAMPVEGVKALVDFMCEFEKNN